MPDTLPDMPYPSHRSPSHPTAHAIAKRLAGIVVLLLLASAAGHAGADAPAGSLYLDGADSRYGLILCHGRGKHPAWKVVNPLRKGVNEQLGYHTLSLHMPVRQGYWEGYARDFPDAYAEIRAAIDFLRNEKGVETVYLMGHSMGSRMVSAYVAYNDNNGVDRLIVAGLRNNGDAVLGGINNLREVTIPVLDIYGGGNSRDTVAAAERETLVSETYKQIAISGANHKFEGYDEEFVNAVVAWLKNME